MIDAPVTAARYVAGQLPDAERIAFEDHFVMCADCQREVEFASAIRLGTDTQRASASTISSRVRRAPRRWIGGGLAIAAGIAAIIILRTSASPALTALGGVREAPVYLGVAVRGTPGRADSIFENAMTAYEARDYATAAAGLRTALAAGQDSVPTEFFLGASLLMSNDARGAAAAFDDVVARREPVYFDEARLYEAKALLRLGRGRDALGVLARSHAADPVLDGALSALADSVAQIVGR
jgi:hypothetical protein